MIDAHIDIRTAARDAIEPGVYGHFLESAFFGNIEGGVLDEGSPRSVSEHGALDGCREDVIEACRELGVPVVRWPGGNFTSGYRWEDGTGPRDDRPRTLELAWGSEESNRFGTPEFLAWAEAVGAEPYLHHGARSVDDAVRWVEYTNHAGRTSLTDRRSADGHPDPYGVRWWGIGNEVYGPWQMGFRSAERYVEDAREHVRFMRAVDPSLRFVASGWERQQWTDTVVAGLGDTVDAFSLHLYGLDHHLVTPTEAEFDAVVAQAVYFDQTIQDYSDEIRDVAARSHVDGPLGIVMDEWNNRHLEPAVWPEPVPEAGGGYVDRREAEPDARGAVRVNRHSPRTLADALMYAGVFHAMHRSARREVPVTMANVVNLVNANGVLQVRPGGIVRTPVFHVFDLYRNHFGSVALRAEVTAPAAWREVRLGAERATAAGVAPVRSGAVSLLDVSAASSPDGSVVTLAVINRSATATLSAALSLDGRTAGLPTAALARTIGAGGADLWATNSIEDPAAVSIVGPTRLTVDDGALSFSPHSITLLEFAVR